MENVVTIVFDVASEAYQAFSELRREPFGTDYAIAEAALLKCEGKAIAIADAFDSAGVTSNDTANGMLIGSLVGILGGPVGVLLGAGVGALAGNILDMNDTIDSVSMLEATAVKLYDNETAIIALVQEVEPAFDAAFQKYGVTIYRHFAADVAAEVDRARELQIELANEAKEQLRAERKADRQARLDERKEAIQAHFEKVKATQKKRRAEFDAALDTANAQFASSTKEMFDEE